MPFPYASSAASVRPRRLRDKDKDIRYRSSSTSSRRSRDQVTLADGRPLTHQPQTTQQLQHTVENATLDQLPPLPLSRTTSPCSATSPLLQIGQAGLKSCETASQPYHIHTPASLQPYLEEDTDSNECYESLLADSQHGQQSCSYPPKEARQSSNPQPYPTKAESPENCARLVAVNTLPSALATEAPQKTLQALSTELSRAPAASETTSDGGHYLDSQRARHRTPPCGPNPIGDTPAPGLPLPIHFPSVQFDNATNNQQAETAQVIPYFPGYTYPTIMPVNPDCSGTLFHYGPSQDLFAYRPLQPLQTLRQSNAELFGRDRDGGISKDPVREDDAAALIYRIQSTMPDIYLLVDRYRETLGQLAFQENLTRQVEAQKSEAVKQKDIYIDHLAKEMDFVAQKHSAETSKLRLELGNLEEKLKKIQDNLVASMDSRMELERDFEKQMSRVQKEHGLKDQAMRADIDALTKAEATVKNELMVIRAEHKEVLDSTREKWSRERADIETRHARERSSLEMVAQTCQGRLKGASQKAQSEREKWDDERNALQQDWNKQRQDLLVQHRQEMEELQKTGKLLYDSEKSRLEDKAARLQRQVETLKSGWDVDKAKLARAQSEHSAITSKLQTEDERLQKMVDAVGEATDLKSRGNTYLRRETAELLFEDWSHRLRRISPTREAIWRQHTLQAAYTARTAKQATNKTAGQVVAEMSGKIKYFIPSDKAEAVRSALKGIVKLAVETWRHARLEKGTIIASMSSDIHLSMTNARVTPRAMPASRTRSEVTATHIITTFPFIGKIELKHNTETDMNGEAYVYSNGLALYQDTPIVLERLAELHQRTTDPHNFHEIGTGPKSQRTRPTDLGECDSDDDAHASTVLSSSVLASRCESAMAIRPMPAKHDKHV
ncbi:hypothetical protein MMC11_001731 [Xylographa trunciseda]|nr:hypothetical protein [Xylographa trunciseda]